MQLYHLAAGLFVDILGTYRQTIIKKKQQRSTDLNQMWIQEKDPPSPTTPQQIWPCITDKPLWKKCIYLSSLTLSYSPPKCLNKESWNHHSHRKFKGLIETPISVAENGGENEELASQSSRGSSSLPGGWFSGGHPKRSWIARESEPQKGRNIQVKDLIILNCPERDIYIYIPPEN